MPLLRPGRVETSSIASITFVLPVVIFFNSAFSSIFVLGISSTASVTVLSAFESPPNELYRLLNCSVGTPFTAVVVPTLSILEVGQSESIASAIPPLVSPPGIQLLFAPDSEPVGSLRFPLS